MTSWTGLRVKRPKTLLSRTFWHKSNQHKRVYTFLGHKCTLSHLDRVYRSQQYRNLLIKSEVGFWTMDTDMLKEEPYCQMITFLLCHWMPKKDRFPSIIDWWDALQNVSRMYGRTLATSGHRHYQPFVNCLW